MRSFRIFRFLLGVFIFACAVSSARAQDDPNFEIGLKPFGSYHMGNIDNVSLSNGSLGVDIPLISYPQRGGKLNLEFALHFFNGSAYVYTFCAYGACADIWTHFLGAFSMIDKSALASVGVTEASYANGAYGQNGIQGADGSVHTMGATATNYLESFDATAYQEVWNSTSSTLSITDPEGTSHTNLDQCYSPFPAGTNSGVFVTGAPPVSCFDSREDASGNQITFSPTTGWTDTMGRVIPLMTQSTNSSDFTGCTGTQSVVFVELWNPPGFSGGTYPLKFCYVTLTYSTQSYTMLQSVVLPNGTAWTFAYSQLTFNGPMSTSSFPGLSQITFPTGGTLAYTWTSTNMCVTQPGVEYNFAVHTRTLNPNDGITPASTWTYTYGTTTPSENTPYSNGINTVTDPAGNDSVHTFGLNVNPDESITCYPYETQAQYYQGSHTGGTLLKTVNTTFSWRVPKANYNGGNYGPYAIANVVPIQVNTTWANQQESQVTYTYDAGFTFYWEAGNKNNQIVEEGSSNTGTFGKELTKSEYDYGTGAPGALLRTTTNTYLALSNSTYKTYNFLDLPSSVQIKDGGGTQRAYTTYSYDGSSLASSGITTQHGTPPNGTYRGNLTSIASWLNTTGTYLTSTKTYFDTGTVNVSKDPKTNPTTYAYSSTYVGALPTTVTNALNQSVTNAYDFNTGLLTSTTDPNSKTNSYVYDYMLRTTQITHPDTGQVIFSYPNPNQVDITETNNYSPNRLSYLIVDGVGREIRQAVTNGETTPYDEGDTCYDGLGRVSFKSYPFQDSGPFTTSRSCGSPEAGDSFAYDALSRKTSATHSDASTVLTSYTGRAASVQDEGNGTQRVQRVSQVDGLGRLASLCEVTSTTLTVGITGSTTPAACGQDIAATGFLATYAYDALDDLTSVAQGPLNARMFVYDSLSRLTSGTNPESGTTTYTYDADGNVLTKKDARSTTITYAYDSLNRLTGKTYSDTTPAATYTYDQSSALGVTLTNTTGRMSSESTAGSYPTGSVFSYDPMGRVNINSQCTPQNCSGTPFSIVYTYDFLGDVHTSTNGAAVTLTNSYNAGARLTSFTSSLSDSNHPGTPFGYQNVAHYNAAGSILSVTLGNGINETRTYDGRLRLTGITDGSIYTLTIPSGYAPNNDILAANDSVNGNWNYAYDGFNRLCASNQAGQTSLLCTSTNNTGQKAFTYAYDRFGNRWNQTVTAGSGPAPSYGFDANNHITGATGVTYDAAGDTTGDGTHAYTYDAEGRVSQVDGGTTATYVYDAEGRRIRKTTAAGGTVDFLYDLAGHEVSQINSTGSWTRGEVYAGGRHVATYSGGTGGATYFIHADWLGTERARSNVAGTSSETCTSLAFGDALTCTGTDVSPMHFTGKEHDTETGLENFGARYDSSSMGRFMTPDWSAEPQAVPYAVFGDPQSLNRYAYVRNRAPNSIDPQGHFDCQGTAYFCFNTRMAAFLLQQASNDISNPGMFQLQKVSSALGTYGDHNGIIVNQGDLGPPDAHNTYNAAQTSADGKTITFNNNSKVLEPSLGDFTSTFVHEGTHVMQHEQIDAAGLNYSGRLGRPFRGSGSPPPLSYAENYRREYQAYQNEGYIQLYMHYDGGIYSSQWSGPDESRHEEERVAQYSRVAACRETPECQP